MFTATIAVTIPLAALVAFAAVRKLTHRPEVVAEYARVGVPEGRLDGLAAILLAGAVGLVAGLAWAPVGVTAAAGLVAYFVVAVAAHVRHENLDHVLTPIAIELLAIAALTLRVATL